MMKKIAIIGASSGQLPLCLKAHELGYQTHCFAYDKGAVCKDYVDYFYPISLIDKEEIVNKCLELKIDAVLSNASDFTAEVSSYVAEQLGLVGAPYDKLISLRDKYYVRTLADNVLGLTSPKYYKYAGVDLGVYPCVIKPCKGGAKKGVSFVADKSDFDKAIQYALSEDSDDITVEEFIEGKELSVECISYRGEHYVLQITDKDSSSAPHFVELGHHQPANIPDSISTKIKQVIPNLLSTIGYDNGASHIEIKYRDDMLFLIEANLRGGGDYISNVLVFLSSGIDYLKCMIDVALGLFTEPDQLTESQYAGVYFLCRQSQELLPFFRDSIGKNYCVEGQIYTTDLSESHSNYERDGYFIYKSDHKIVPNEF